MTIFEQAIHDATTTIETLRPLQATHERAAEVVAAAEEWRQAAGVWQWRQLGGGCRGFCNYRICLRFLSDRHRCPLR